VGLRSRSLFVVVALVLLVAPQSARAETGSAPATQIAATSACGKTIDEKLAAAQKALQADDAAARPALACLIEATAALNDRVHNDEDGHPAAGVLVLPKFAVGPQPNQ
jgi:hypothetical protein